MNIFLPLMHRSRCLLAALVISLLCLPLPSIQPAQAAPTVRLRGHVPTAALARARAMGRVPGSETLSLALALPGRDPAGLETFLNRVYTPGDPLYRHYLTPQEFTQRFGPTQQSYDAVIAFARANGLTITRTHPNHLLVDVSGPAASVEAAFAVHLRRYAAEDGHIFHAPDSEPAIPVSLAGRLHAVIGLETAAFRRSNAIRVKSAPHLAMKQALVPAAIPGEIGTDPYTGDNALQPSDIKAAYGLSNVSLTGAGQTLALVEFDGYTPSDITTYNSSFGLPNVPLENILVDGYDGSANGGADEVTLDIEAMNALAPGASKILVYEAPNSSAASTDMYNKIANDNRAKVVSSSWGVHSENQAQDVVDTENTIFQQMAAQGQSVFILTGDYGAYDDAVDLSVEDPGSQPYVTAVGGTKLAVRQPGGPYLSESAWGDANEATFDAPLGAGGGGGISDIWPLPDYQIGVGLSATQRNVPDVSLDADPATGYAIYYTDPQNPNQPWTVIGGTSVSTPLWAAFAALVNQQRAINGEASLGFANPLIYQIGRTPAQYALGFHDPADGSTNLFYPTKPGYDNATGWGSFNGANLLALLAPAVNTTANPIASLTLSPNPVVGGLSVVGTLMLTNPAPAGGATVTLSTSNTGIAPVQATVFLTAGQSVANFRINTAVVTTQTPVTINATYLNTSQSATLVVVSSPPAAAPMSLTLSPDSVNGGDASTATLTLTGTAPATGLTVTLTSSDPAVKVPASIIVPAGAISATFNVITSQVVKQVVATLSAAANGGTATGTLTVLPPTLQKLVLTPDHLPGGQKSTGNLALTSIAPGGGAVVTLSSDNPAAQVPATFTIPTGTTTAVFPITTSPVPTTVVATIKATYGGLSQTAKLTVQSPQILSLSVAPAALPGGASSTGTVTLDSPVAAAAGLIITLSESSTAATIPATVTVAQGATTATFPITTAPVPSGATDTITATLGTHSQTAVLTIQPIQVTGLTFSPSQVVTGTPSQGTVTISSAAPAGGLAVSLSSQGAAETLPTSALIPAGATSVSFPVATPTPGIATVSAVIGGQTRTATLTVTIAPGTSYPAGLSMISAPYAYSGQPLDAVFGVTGVKLAVWQPGANTYAVTPNAPADAIRLGQGYWVRLAKAVTLVSAGTPADPKTDFPITLGTGWNQIGDPFLVPITLSNLHVSSGGATSTFAQAAAGTPLLLSNLVYRWNQSSSTYALTPADGSLQPGVGYWIYAYQPVTLIVPHPGQ